MARLKQTWNVEEADRALATELHKILEISHRQAKGLIDAGCVEVNDQPARTHGQRLTAGDSIKVDFEVDRAYQPLPGPNRSADSPFEMLFEDRDLIFVNKPAGLLTVPAEKGNEPCLADALTESYRRRGQKRVQLYVVHRLDRYTSGVLVFAKTPEAMHGLKALFEDHKLQRIYKAILVGELPENSGTLSGRIVENPKSLRMRVVQPRQGDTRPRGSKDAITHFRVMERLPGHTVVEVRLETGRRNQIRVQFADRGYPLLGDQVYGQPSELLDRQALHAELLGFRHPVTEDAVSASAPLPADMEAALKTLRLKLRLGRAEAGKTGEEGLYRPKISHARKQDRIRRSKRFEIEGAPAEPASRTSRPGREDAPREGRRPTGPRAPRSGEDRPDRSAGPRPPRRDAERPTHAGAARQNREEIDRPSRPRSPRPERAEGPRPARTGSPRPSRDEGERPPRSAGPRSERPSGPRSGPGRPSTRPAGPRREGAPAGRPRAERPSSSGSSYPGPKDSKGRKDSAGSSSRKPRPAAGFKPRKPR
jgi:23S rRNA pseudouridine1911/1915/1917 synthase